MINRDHLDQAGLAGLGWLDDPERTDFEHECVINPHLRKARADTCDLIAAVAATAPHADPPSHALAGIIARLSTVEPMGRPASAGRWRPRAVAHWVPWAVAAGFAVLAAWTSWHSHELATRGGDATGTGAPGGGTGTGGAPDADGTGGSTPVAGSPSAVTPATGEAPRPGTLPHRYFTNRGSDPVLRLRQDKERLSAEVGRLRAAEEARQQLPPGMSDLRIVEMLPPGTTKPPVQTNLLGPRVTEAIATGLNAPASTSPDPKPAPGAPETIRLRGHGTNPDATIELTEGFLSLPSLNLHRDAQLVHTNFPPPEQWESYGLLALDADSVYDGHGTIYRRAANGKDWIGQVPPPDWPPPDPDEPGATPVPPLRPKPTSGDPSTPPETSTSEPSGVPSALPVLDQQGHGTLIVQNLPPAPDGEFYHLWMDDPRFPGPIDVGVLPPMESAYDRFGFDLGAPGFLPTRYLLTLEKAGAVTAPGNRIILQGP